MSKPIVTIALSDDGNSVFVYSGGVQLASDNSSLAYDADTRELETVLGIQREDFDFQLREYVSILVSVLLQS